MTRDDIIRMAREAWVFPEAHIPNILEFANLVAAAEREECAKVCEARNSAYCAFSIRERGAP
jgi:hypothetical protein